MFERLFDDYLQVRPALKPWSDNQTLFVKHVKLNYQAMFEHLNTSQNIA